MSVYLMMIFCVLPGTQRTSRPPSVRSWSPSHGPSTSRVYGSVYNDSGETSMPLLNALRTMRVSETAPQDPIIEEKLAPSQGAAEPEDTTEPNRAGTEKLVGAGAVSPAADQLMTPAQGMSKSAKPV